MDVTNIIELMILVITYFFLFYSIEIFLRIMGELVRR